MKKYFDTKEEAEKELEKRRKSAYKRIEKKGWKILGDDSKVYQDFIWKTEEKFFYEMAIGKLAGLPPDENDSKIFESTQTDTKKWFTWLAIVTDEMIKDLQKIKSIDVVQQLENELVEELQNKK